MVSRTPHALSCCTALTGSNLKMHSGVAEFNNSTTNSNKTTTMVKAGQRRNQGIQSLFFIIGESNGFFTSNFTTERHFKRFITEKLLCTAEPRLFTATNHQVSRNVADFVGT